MARWFNIGGPCNPADNYVLSAMDRLPDVAALVRKRQYFVVHAPRQCGKTTAFLQRVSEGWLVVADPDLTKPWDGKIFTKDIPWQGKMIHVLGC